MKNRFNTVTNIFQMTDDEKEAYFAELDQWMGTDYALLTASPWSQTQVAVFNEGLRLISVHPRSTGFLQVCNKLPVVRKLDELHGLLSSLLEMRPTLMRKEQSALETTSAEKNESSDTQRTQKVATKKEKLVKVTKSDMRPDHFSEWFDKMSPALQAHIEELKTLHTMRVHYRQEVERLAACEKYSEAEMSRVATLAVGYEHKIQAIYDMSQLEWDALMGKEVSDETKQLVAEEYKKAEKRIADGNKIDTDAPKATRGTTSRKAKQGKRENEKKVQPATARAGNVVLDDDYLKELTYPQLVAVKGLEDGARKFWLDRRVTNIRRWLIQHFDGKVTRKQSEKARQCVEEMICAGKGLSETMLKNARYLGVHEDLLARAKKSEQ